MATGCRNGGHRDAPESRTLTVAVTSGANARKANLFAAKGSPDFTILERLRATRIHLHPSSSMRKTPAQSQPPCDLLSEFFQGATLGIRSLFQARGMGLAGLGPQVSQFR